MLPMVVTVAKILKLIRRALAGHWDIFQADGESRPLNALLDALDLPVEAGRAEARQLTPCLDELYEVDQYFNTRPGRDG
jgi:hypothetical protein